MYKYSGVLLSLGLGDCLEEGKQPSPGKQTRLSRYSL